MTTSRVIEATAAACYRRGCHPLDVAEAITQIITEDVFGLPDSDPRAALLARRIVGGLLDAGWTMPGRTTTP
jgi:hypothetical protein